MKDLLFECNDQGMSEKEFTDVFCKVCKNRKCARASWAFSTWDERIITQVDRFFHTPTIKQSEASQYQGISDFEEYHINPAIDVWTPSSLDFSKTQPKHYEVSGVQTSPTSYQKPLSTQDEINTPVQNSYYVGEVYQNNIKENQPVQQPKDEWSLPPKTLKVGGKFQMGK
jgi:hypothetical protein